MVLSGKVVLQDLSKMFCCLRSSVGIKLEKPVVNVADQMKFVQNTQVVQKICSSHYTLSSLSSTNF